QGRVWTGIKAQELGLVDEIGYLDDAFAAAAQHAGLEEYQVKLIERDLTPQEQLIRRLLGSESVRSAWQTLGVNSIGGEFAWLQQLKRSLPDELGFLLQGKTQTVYALCLECAVLD